MALNKGDLVGNLNKVLLDNDALRDKVRKLRAENHDKEIARLDKEIKRLRKELEKQRGSYYDVHGKKEGLESQG